MDEGGTADPLVRFGARLRELRHARALSQFALSERAGLDHSYVSNCERGRLNITLRNIHKLAAALGVEPAELFRPPADTPDGG
jgi:transcriptional regulator with XRE-family HTH domain